MSLLNFFRRPFTGLFLISAIHYQGVDLQVGESGYLKLDFKLKVGKFPVQSGEIKKGQDKYPAPL